MHLIIGWPQVYGMVKRMWRRLQEEIICDGSGDDESDVCRQEKISCMAVIVEASQILEFE